MKKFEIGHTYFAPNLHAPDTIKIVGRSAEYVTFERDGKTRRAKVYADATGEYIMPDRYSMASVYRADRELLPEQVEEAQPVLSYYLSGKLTDLWVYGTCTGRLNAKQLGFLDALAEGSAGTLFYE